MTLGHWLNCKHAPRNPSTRHCTQYNTGETSNTKATMRGQRKGEGTIPRLVGKGNHGCASKCRYFKEKEEK